MAQRRLAPSLGDHQHGGMEPGLPPPTTPPPVPSPAPLAAAAPAPVTEKKHSGLGIASFVIGLVTTVVMFAGIVVVVMMQAVSRAQVDTHSPMIMLLGLVVILSGFVYLLGIGLGIAGVLQRDRKRTFAVLGLIINIAVPVLLVALGIFGQMTKKRREHSRAPAPTGLVGRVVPVARPTSPKTPVT